MVYERTSVLPRVVRFLLGEVQISPNGYFSVLVRRLLLVAQFCLFMNTLRTTGSHGHDALLLVLVAESWAGAYCTHPTRSHVFIKSSRRIASKLSPVLFSFALSEYRSGTTGVSLLFSSLCRIDAC